MVSSTSPVRLVSWNPDPAKPGYVKVLLRIISDAAWINPKFVIFSQKLNRIYTDYTEVELVEGATAVRELSVSVIDNDTYTFTVTSANSEVSSEVVKITLRALQPPVINMQEIFYGDGLARVKLTNAAADLASANKIGFIYFLKSDTSHVGEILLDLTGDTRSPPSTLYPEGKLVGRNLGPNYYEIELPNGLYSVQSFFKNDYDTSDLSAPFDIFTTDEFLPVDNLTADLCDASGIMIGSVITASTRKSRGFYLNWTRPIHVDPEGNFEYKIFQLVDNKPKLVVTKKKVERSEYSVLTQWDNTPFVAGETYTFVVMVDQNPTDLDVQTLLSYDQIAASSISTKFFDIPKQIKLINIDVTDTIVNPNLFYWVPVMDATFPSDYFLDPLSAFYDISGITFTFSSGETVFPQSFAEVSLHRAKGDVTQTIPVVDLTQYYNNSTQSGIRVTFNLNMEKYELVEDAGLHLSETNVSVPAIYTFNVNPVKSEPTLATTVAIDYANSYGFVKANRSTGKVNVVWTPDNTTKYTFVSADVFADGVKKATATGNNYVIEGLSPGDHVILVTAKYFDAFNVISHTSVSKTVTVRKMAAAPKVDFKLAPNPMANSQDIEMTITEGVNAPLMENTLYYKISYTMTVDKDGLIPFSPTSYGNITTEYVTPGQPLKQTFAGIVSNTLIYVNFSVTNAYTGNGYPAVVDPLSIASGIYPLAPPLAGLTVAQVNTTSQTSSLQFTWASGFKDGVSFKILLNGVDTNAPITKGSPTISYDASFNIIDKNTDPNSYNEFNEYIGDLTSDRSFTVFTATLPLTEADVSLTKTFTLQPVGNATVATFEPVTIAPYQVAYLVTDASNALIEALQTGLDIKVTHLVDRNTYWSSGEQLISSALPRGRKRPDYFHFYVWNAPNSLNLTNVTFKVKDLSGTDLSVATTATQALSSRGVEPQILSSNQSYSLAGATDVYIPFNDAGFEVIITSPFLNNRDNWNGIPKIIFAVTASSINGVLVDAITFTEPSRHLMEAVPARSALADAKLVLDNTSTLTFRNGYSQIDQQDILSLKFTQDAALVGNQLLATLTFQDVCGNMLDRHTSDLLNKHAVDLTGIYPNALLESTDIAVTTFGVPGKNYIALNYSKITADLYTILSKEFSVYLTPVGSYDYSPQYLLTVPAVIPELFVTQKVNYIKFEWFPQYRSHPVIENFKIVEFKEGVQRRVFVAGTKTMLDGTGGQVDLSSPPEYLTAPSDPGAYTYRLTWGFNNNFHIEKTVQIAENYDGITPDKTDVEGYAAVVLPNDGTAVTAYIGVSWNAVPAAPQNTTQQNAFALFSVAGVGTVAKPITLNATSAQLVLTDVLSAFNLTTANLFLNGAITVSRKVNYSYPLGASSIQTFSGTIELMKSALVTTPSSGVSASGNVSKLTVSYNGWSGLDFTAVGLFPNISFQITDASSNAVENTYSVNPGLSSKYYGGSYDFNATFTSVYKYYTTTSTITLNLSDGENSAVSYSKAETTTPTLLYNSLAPTGFSGINLNYANGSATSVTFTSYPNVFMGAGVNRYYTVELLTQPSAPQGQPQPVPVSLFKQKFMDNTPGNIVKRMDGAQAGTRTFLYKIVTCNANYEPITDSITAANTNTADGSFSDTIPQSQTISAFSSLNVEHSLDQISGFRFTGFPVTFENMGFIAALYDASDNLMFKQFYGKDTNDNFLPPVTVQTCKGLLKKGVYNWNYEVYHASTQNAVSDGLYGNALGPVSFTASQTLDAFTQDASGVRVYHAVDKIQGLTFDRPPVSFEDYLITLSDASGIVQFRQYVDKFGTKTILQECQGVLKPKEIEVYNDWSYKIEHAKNNVVDGAYGLVTVSGNTSFTVDRSQTIYAATDPQLTNSTSSDSTVYGTSLQVSIQQKSDLITNLYFNTPPVTYDGRWIAYFYDSEGTNTYVLDYTIDSDGVNTDLTQGNLDERVHTWNWVVSHVALPDQSKAENLPPPSYTDPRNGLSVYNTQADHYKNSISFTVSNSNKLSDTVVSLSHERDQLTRAVIAVPVGFNANYQLIVYDLSGNSLFKTNYNGTILENNSFGMLSPGLYDATNLGLLSFDILIDGTVFAEPLNKNPAYPRTGFCRALAVLASETIQNASLNIHYHYDQAYLEWNREPVTFDGQYSVVVTATSGAASLDASRNQIITMTKTALNGDLSNLTYVSNNTYSKNLSDVTNYTCVITRMTTTLASLSTYNSSFVFTKVTKTGTLTPYRMILDPVQSEMGMRLDMYIPTSDLGSISQKLTVTVGSTEYTNTPAMCATIPPSSSELTSQAYNQTNGLFVTSQAQNSTALVSFLLALDGSPAGISKSVGVKLLEFADSARRPQQVTIERTLTPIVMYSGDVTPVVFANYRSTAKLVATITTVSRVTENVDCLELTIKDKNNVVVNYSGNPEWQPSSTDTNTATYTFVAGVQGLVAGDYTYELSYTPSKSKYLGSRYNGQVDVSGVIHLSGAPTISNITVSGKTVTITANANNAFSSTAVSPLKLTLIASPASPTDADAGKAIQTVDATGTKLGSASTPITFDLSADVASVIAIASTEAGVDIASWVYGSGFSDNIAPQNS